MIKIFRHTNSSFGDAIQNILGKGRQQAQHLYEEFFRNGTCLGTHACFNNAQNILKEILQLTDFTALPIIKDANDGATEKFLIQTEDDLEIEAVEIPMQSGGTLCISSQVGCRMGCAFCETGRMGLLRNLEVTEILSQVFVARHLRKFQFRNIVFMGMGEPFDNFNEVMQAAEILQEPKGFGFGRKNITISTSGCVDGIEKLIQAGTKGPNLAVSINAPEDTLRSRLMPVNKKFNLALLKQTMQNYCTATGREILIGYVLIEGQNADTSHADQLASYLEGLNVKINLIPYNRQSNDRFSAPDLSTQEQFAKKLRDRGYYTLLRLTKGHSIMAACGQLGNLALRKKRSTLSLVKF